MQVIDFFKNAIVFWAVSTIKTTLKLSIDLSQRKQIHKLRDGQ